MDGRCKDIAITQLADRWQAREHIGTSGVRESTTKFLLIRSELGRRLRHRGVPLVVGHLQFLRLAREGLTIRAVLKAEKACRACTSDISVIS
jgi:hypothetical protein